MVGEKANNEYINTYRRLCRGLIVTNRGLAASREYGRLFVTDVASGLIAIRCGSRPNPASSTEKEKQNKRHPTSEAQ